MQGINFNCVILFQTPTQMAFINRFLKIPIQIYNQKQAEMTNNPEYEDVYAYILPTEIDEMFPTVSDSTNKPVTFVYMKSGRTCIVEMAMEKFIKLLENHFDQ